MTDIPRKELPNEHGNCPHCGYDLNGAPIWEHFYKEFQETGYWLDEEGNYVQPNRILMPDEAEIAADKVASSYGASREKGRFGKAIGIYDRVSGRAVAWKCPRCDGRWNRGGL